LDKNKKIILSVVVIAVIVIAVVAAYYITGVPTAQKSLLPSGQVPQGQVTLTGDISTPATLTVQDLSMMPLTNVTVTIKGETATYVGVTILELLNKAGASWDTGFITLVGSDGYSKTINFYQAYNSTQHAGEEIILAFVENHKWIPGTSDGPFELIAPGFAPAYDVYGVTKINLQPWTISVTGTTSAMTLISSNLTKYGTQTVQATFAPGCQPHVTANWTGVSLWNILQAGGIPSGASNVTVTGIDGYNQEFSISQVQSIGILIGYQENGQYLTPSMGQPYRLILPSADYESGSYWVSWIAQITVS
jgi:DMSO/TMAO reductase YedYZ molybdopterin-dependent catalytic subunit